VEMALEDDGQVNLLLLAESKGKSQGEVRTLLLPGGFD